jgi:hypothetical protein
MDWDSNPDHPLELPQYDLCNQHLSPAYRYPNPRHRNNRYNTSSGYILGPEHSLDNDCFIEYNNNFDCPLFIYWIEAVLNITAVPELTLGKKPGLETTTSGQRKGSLTK